MPIFDYFCNFCGQIKGDELVKNSDEVVKCSKGHKMSKGIGAPALIGFDSNGTSKSGRNGKG